MRHRGRAGARGRMLGARHRIAVPLALLVAGTAGVAIAAGVTVGAAKREALRSVAFVASELPRERGFKLASCHRIGGGKLTCSYTVSVRALSGGTITCQGQIVVTPAAGTVSAGATGPASTSFAGSRFIGKPYCARDRRR